LLYDRVAVAGRAASGCRKWEAGFYKGREVDVRVLAKARVALKGGRLGIFILA
jgi:hypothetical protein